MTNPPPTQLNTRQLPKWRRYSIVSAIRIRSIIPTPESTQAALIMPADPSFYPIPVTAGFLKEYKPEAGGYFVIDDKENPEFIPASKFEVEYAPYLYGDDAGPNSAEGK